MPFPIIRLRRLRGTETIRKLVRETQLSIDDFVYPMFVIYGKEVRNPIRSMPEVYQLSIDNLVKEVQEVADLGFRIQSRYGWHTKLYGNRR